MGDVILTECFRDVVQTARVRPRDSKARHLRAAICHMIAQGGSRVMLASRVGPWFGDPIALTRGARE